MNKFPHLEELLIQALKKHVKDYELGFSGNFTLTIKPNLGQTMDANGKLQYIPHVPGAIELVQFTTTLQVDHQETQSSTSVIPRKLLDETKPWKWVKQKHPNPHNPEDWD